MRRIALALTSTLASAALLLVGCGSSAPPAKSPQDLPADPHDSVGGASPDGMNSSPTSNGNAPKEEQKNDKADETKTDAEKK